MRVLEIGYRALVTRGNRNIFETLQNTLTSFVVIGEFYRIFLETLQILWIGGFALKSYETRTH